MSNNTLFIVLVIVALCSGLCGAFSVYWHSIPDIKSQMKSKGIDSIDMIMKWEKCTKSPDVCTGVLEPVDKDISGIDITWNETDKDNKAFLKCVNGDKDFPPPDPLKVPYTITYPKMTPHKCIKDHWSAQKYHYVMFPLSIIMLIAAMFYRAQ